MLTADKIAEIKRLLDTAVSRRVVARLAGVSRPTVDAIANGKHRPGGRRHRAAEVVAEQCFATVRAFAERGVAAKLAEKRKRLQATG